MSTIASSLNGLPSIPLSPTAKPRRANRISGPLHRNVHQVILTDLRIDTWYPSFYPESLVGRSTDRLYVCKLCFKYTTQVDPFIEHTTKCRAHIEGPPGHKMYEKEDISVYVVDGDEHKVCLQA